MIKDIMAANESVAPNSREMDILKEYFPSCFHSDGSFDLTRFQEFLNDKVAVAHEGYELKFLGKNYARLLASVDTTTVIVPDEEHNSKPENAHSENIYISGDNLDGLKHLLKSYSRKVKCFAFFIFLSLFSIFRVLKRDDIFYSSSNSSFLKDPILLLLTWPSAKPQFMLILPS